MNSGALFRNLVNSDILYFPMYPARFARGQNFYLSTKPFKSLNAISNCIWVCNYAICTWVEIIFAQKYVSIADDCFKNSIQLVLSVFSGKIGVFPPGPPNSLSGRILKKRANSVFGVLTTKVHPQVFFFPTRTKMSKKANQHPRNPKTLIY